MEKEIENREKKINLLQLKIAMNLRKIVDKRKQVKINIT